MLLKIRHGAAVLVDRNGFQRKMLRTLLRSSGFNRVTEFDDMESGLDEASRSYPDFLFVDFDTAEHSDLLRGHKDLNGSYLSPNTNLVFLMQDPTRKRVKNAISSGGKWVISRPFSPTSLNRRIRAILDPSFCVSLNSIAPKPAEPDKNASQEDLSMAELARQMDGLLKQSRFFQDGQELKNDSNPEKPEAELKPGQSRLKTEIPPQEKEEDIFLI